MSTYSTPQQFPGSNPGAYGPPPQPRTNPMATAGFVVALVGAVLALIPVIGTISWLISPVGLVLAIVGLAMSGRRGGAGRGLGIAGVLLGVLGLVLCLAYTISFVNYVNSQASVPSSSSTSAASGAGAPRTVEADNSVRALGGVFSEGTYEVGTGSGEIAPGKYTTAGAGHCYWERLSATDGDFSSILANGNENGPSVVTIKASDAAFSVSGSCYFSKK